MHIQKESGNTAISIKAYEPGKLTISGAEYDYPLLLSANGLTAFTATEDFSQLTAHHLESLVETDTEILLLGSGEKHQFLPANQTAQLIERGTAVECMSTRNACHTFQVLAYEKRKVIALLFP